MNRKRKRRRSVFNVPFFNEWKVPGIITSEARKKKQVIYGRRALNKQVPGFVRAQTQDYDIYARRPKRAANLMQAKLDKEVASGRDFYYMKPAEHPGTYKVMSKGRDKKKGTEDDVGVADYTKMPRNQKYVVIEGNRYEKISSIARGKKEILKDPESKYRHEKDREDLRRIKVAKLFRR